ncbi:hypothetical protein T08_10634 [Trichinella sp. T8]|nr:hypothetical protein T08_10634 [Trichinella sp. T8]
MKNPDKASQYEREVFHTHSQIGRTWYLPHHTIVPRYEGTSLNQHLNQGQPQQNDLVKILIIFWRFCISTQSDILPINQYQWLCQSGCMNKVMTFADFSGKTMKSKKHLVYFVLNELTCSPFLATCVIKHHAKKNRNEFPEVEREVRWLPSRNAIEK